MALVKNHLKALAIGIRWLDGEKNTTRTKKQSNISHFSLSVVSGSQVSSWNPSREHRHQYMSYLGISPNSRNCLKQLPKLKQSDYFRPSSVKKTVKHVGIAPCKWPTHWDTYIPIKRGAKNGWQTRETRRHCTEASPS